MSSRGGPAGLLREDRFDDLFDRMLTLWEAVDFTDCATWFERSEAVAAAFASLDGAVDLAVMNSAVHRSIAIDAPFEVSVRELVNRETARTVFEVELRRVLLGAAGVWRLTEVEVARGYFG
ncbi:hypothetical protein [Caulobacter hibisci]|uniref:Tim44-like domain-containing protein n=1 Tax=Caulobacter hibisci TaxID=2035993 RepID=A0ABS0T569_9CAUL|nr:hypothetical protein [Caulobacter hibisci]MBI1686994.1 hypothetical protein [Caulobacter hibisci]